jgi:hypothetical protein
MIYETPFYIVRPYIYIHFAVRTRDMTAIVDWWRANKSVYIEYVYKSRDSMLTIQQECQIKARARLHRATDQRLDRVLDDNKLAPIWPSP